MKPEQIVKEWGLNPLFCYCQVHTDLDYVSFSVNELPQVLPVLTFLLCFL